MWLRDIERMTRLVRPYRKDGIAVEPAPRAPNHGFTRRLTATDAAVLAEMMSVWDPVIPCELRLGVHQLPSRRAAGNVASRVHHITPPAFKQYRIGGVQERRSRVQTSGLCPNLTTRAGLVNDFCANRLNPCVNFYRSCFFVETITDAKGKERRRDRYEEIKTLYEQLKSIPYASQHLKPASPLNN